MDEVETVMFSESICRNYAVDASVVEAVKAGDGDINLQELLKEMFKGFDELEALGFLDEEQSLLAKVEITGATYWAGQKIREFDEKRQQHL